jgi:diguanylate cyclase (GGDEF)-like protein/PAS domain S-box-containing protein
MPSVRRLLVSPRRSVALLTAVASTAVALLAVSSILLASNTVTQVANRQLNSTAAVSAVIIGQRQEDLMRLVHSYASRPSLAAGMVAGRRGSGAVAFTLAEIARAVPGISASFVTDLHGTSLNTYPPEPSVYGTNFAYRDWFKGLVASGRPFVSNAIETKEASRALAVTVTDYITGRDGRRVGVLGVNYGLQSIRSFAASIAGAEDITLTVTDRSGTSLTAGEPHGLVSLAGDPRVKAALAGGAGLLDYTPVSSHGGHRPEELSAYAPVAGIGWTVIASIPKSVALAGVIRLRAAVLAISGLLALILLATIAIVARSDRRRRASERQVQSRERELARVLESTHEAFLATDASGAITAWNTQAEMLFGWPASEVLGRSLSDTVIPPAYRNEHAALLASTRGRIGPTGFGKRVELIGLHRDGHEMPVEMSSWAQEDGDGFNAFVHDITERVTVQAELADQRSQLENLNTELISLARHDPLTGLSNRRVLEEDLETLGALVGRYGHRYSMCLLDIDHFKAYNDAYGHLAGDAVLRAVGAQLKQQIRTGDTIYRYGGEEFLCILPEQTLASGILATERMRAAVQSLNITHPVNSTGVVTISAGVATLDPDRVRSVRDVLKEADDALYLAKQQGRNRVETIVSTLA